MIGFLTGFMTAVLFMGVIVAIKVAWERREQDPIEAMEIPLKNQIEREYEWMMRQEVSDYGQKLAGQDPVLRVLMNRFAKTGRAGKA